MEQHFPKEQDRLYRRIYGGVAWPGKRPGFAVIVAQRKEPPWDLVLLDEVEAPDIRALVRACGGFDFFYKPDGWLGDPENAAACRFVREMNAENREAHAPGRAFHLRRSPALDLKNPFDYIYPTVKKLLAQQRLILKEGKAKEYMGHPQASDLPALEWGDWPAIEALAFVVLELDRVRDAQPKAHYAKNDYNHL